MMMIFLKNETIFTKCISKTNILNYFISKIIKYTMVLMHLLSASRDNEKTV